ncbi:MAG TPA: GTPase Era [Acidimicrobiales bacterium]|nr:GTPase Era [Acidimicrobiales bacterium]
MRSGFATLVGRPNVGKSSLANAILGTKMAIVSDKPQTTRTEIRGVVHRPGAQLVLTDTPGVHKPRTALGHRLNDTALHAVGGGDLVVLVLDATAPVGTGDRFVAARVPPGSLVVVNKVDAASRAQVLGQLVRAANLGLGDCYPVSARTGEGVALLVDAMVAALPEGPALYPPEVVTETPEAEWVAELVREQLLGICRDELPHSIACRVVEWEWPRVRCEILVERESQKGIVIGRRGAVLKAVGTAVRQELPPGAFLELVVRVERDWPRQPRALDELGY